MVQIRCSTNICVTQVSIVLSLIVLIWKSFGRKQLPIYFSFISFVYVNLCLLFLSFVHLFPSLFSSKNFHIPRSSHEYFLYDWKIFKYRKEDNEVDESYDLH